MKETNLHNKVEHQRVSSAQRNSTNKQSLKPWDRMSALRHVCAAFWLWFNRFTVRVWPYLQETSLRSHISKLSIAALSWVFLKLLSTATLVLLSRLPVYGMYLAVPFTIQRQCELLYPSVCHFSSDILKHTKVWQRTLKRMVVLVDCRCPHYTTSMKRSALW